MTSMIVEKEISQEESILNEFTYTLKALQKKYNSSIMFLVVISVKLIYCHYLFINR